MKIIMEIPGGFVVQMTRDELFTPSGSMRSVVRANVGPEAAEVVKLIEKSKQRSGWEPTAQDKARLQILLGIQRLEEAKEFEERPVCQTA